jgi:hypothetical protein
MSFAELRSRPARSFLSRNDQPVRRNRVHAKCPLAASQMSGALHPLDFSMTIKDNMDNKGNTTFTAMITGAKRFGPQKSCAAVT